MKDKLQNQSGVSLIAAIFIIVILAFMGVVFLTLFTSTNVTSTNELQSTQALYVAEGGLERSIRYFVSPTLTERVACASIPSTNTALGSGEFSLTIEAGSPFYSSSATTLSGGIVAGDTTINVGSTANYAPFGRIMIDREIIDYTGTTAGSFTGALRGRDGTTATSHANGTRVGQYQCTVTSTGGVYNLTSPNARRQVRQGIQLQEGWAVGNAVGGGMGGAGEVILRWDGVNWSRMAAVAAIPNTNLRSVSMLSYADGWAVGNQSGGEVILRWTGGPNWTRVGPSGGIPNTNLNSVFCVASNDCWIVGNNDGGEVILRWTGGPNWTRVGPSGALPNTDLNSVYCVASNDCWAVGDVWNPPGANPNQGSIFSWAGGPNWNVVSYPATRPDANLNSVFCVASNDCWAVGDVWNPPGANPNQGSILRWTGGPNWNVVSYAAPWPNARLNSVFCVASNDCWIVGDDDGNEVILRWTGGPNWTRVGPSGALPNTVLNSVYCVTSNDCWAVGDTSGGELIIHWDGTSWSRWGPSGSIPNENLRSVYVIGPKQKPQAMWREVFQ